MQDTDVTKPESIHIVQLFSCIHCTTLVYRNVDSVHYNGGYEALPLMVLNLKEKSPRVLPGGEQNNFSSATTILFLMPLTPKSIKEQDVHIQHHSGKEENANYTTSTSSSKEWSQVYSETRTLLTYSEILRCILSLHIKNLEPVLRCLTCRAVFYCGAVCVSILIFSICCL